METILLSKEDFESLEKKISEIKVKLDAALPLLEQRGKKWYSVTETCKMLNISKRTLQRYRDQGMIAFSQIKGKIFFESSDIHAFLEKFKVNSWSKGGKNEK